MNNIQSNNVVESLIAKWGDLTSEAESEAPNLPVAVLLGEAVDLSELAKAHIHPTRFRGKKLPGLSTVFSATQFNERTVEEMYELQIAASAVAARLRNLEDEKEGITVEDAEGFVRELRSALAFVLDDSEFTEGEQALDRLRDLESESHSHDELAVTLEGYADLAEKYSSHLNQLGDYDNDTPAKARQAAQSLRLRSATALTGEANRKKQEMQSLRNRLLNALNLRMRHSRKAIRYVFRDHPEIAQKAGSGYLREAKRRSRKQSKQEGDLVL